MLDIPRLHTKRLILREMVMADFSAYAALMASPRAKGMGGPHDAAAAWHMFCHDMAQWPLLGHGALMVDLAETGECIGQVGISHGPLYPEPELGWFLYDGSEGKGYATEAAGALRDWAFSTLKLETLVSYTDADNAGSIAVARRLGAVLDRQAPRPRPDDLVWRHFRR
ncbi:GNAT family N-acetyltransferase [Martelella alba]|uniref:GNAT family N-acetyltransferase n=1 Tax=Martelella alba TaxID=2590451 RepID=A0A506U841_9HYPH|nr:GNAT family N-acetyltransferase [Martelella alba]TPW30060.1 GNAT family N-acetyltransferase [Martelella alba]